MRREILDNFLETYRPLFMGVVIDIGGEVNNYRGSFCLPKRQTDKWHVVNIDEESGADIISSATNIPIDDEQADVVLMTEVLEHIEEPQLALIEAVRLLKPGGNLILTMPFMYQVHGDPHDFTRWTSHALINNLKKAGFSSITLMPMGGTWSVIYDTLRSQLYRMPLKNKLRFRIFHTILYAVKPLFKFLDKSCTASRQYITTGWAVKAEK